MTGDVAERIEFRDVTVTFDDGTPPQPFDFNEAFASTDHPPAFDWGNDGAVDSSDQGYLWGIKLTLYNTFGGRALVQLQMSLVLRYGVADMEPFRQIKGAKLYPQIGVQWTPGNGRVRAFRGCVRIVLKNALSTGMGMGTVASLFADSNKVGFYRRFRIFPDVPLPFEFPSWAVFFDYHRPNLQSEVEVVGVYGPNDPAPMLDIRKKDYTWPPATNYQLTVQKYPRQGEYDNFHSHGNMGPDLLDPANPPGPMIHAPGCAEACFHLHWRWGWFAKLFFIGSDIFLGWTDEGLASQPHTARGTPLVPPNQRLQVAVTRPDTVRQDPSSDVVTASRQLDPNQQAIWYTADVIDPRPGDLQVILEQGVAYAYDYDTNSPFLYASLEGTRKLLGKPDTIPFDEEVHDWYQLMRWYQGPGANVEQVPDGTLAQPGLPTPEKL